MNRSILCLLPAKCGQNVCNVVQILFKYYAKIVKTLNIRVFELV